MRVFTFVAHNVMYAIIEIESAGGYARYNLYKNIDWIGLIEFPLHVNPKFSVSLSGQVAFYGGSNVYFPKDKNIDFFEEEEEISCVWFVDDKLFLECDTLLKTRLLLDFSVKNEYWHEEIITQGFFLNPYLFVFRDLNNSVFELSMIDFSVCSSDYPFPLLI